MLEKRIEVSKNVKWLHKDVKLSQKKIPKELSEEKLEVMAHRAVSSTLGNSTLDNLQNFCTEFVSRLGPECFQSFIARHEATLGRLIYIPHYKAYLKSCARMFKNDFHLLGLLSLCDFRQLNSDSIPKLIREENFDSEHQIEHRSQYYLRVMPKPSWVFDDYLSVIVEPVMVRMSNLVPVYLSESDIPHMVTDRDYPFLDNHSKLLKTPTKKLVIDRIMTFTQKRGEVKDKSLWVYLQVDLGRDELLEKKNVLKTLEKIGVAGVKSTKLFHNDPPVQELGLNELDNDLHSIDISIVKEMNIQNISELSKNSRSSVIKQPGNSDEILTGEISTNSSELDKDRERFDEMIKFSSRVNPKNKAYGFVELTSLEDKQLALNEYFRLFGIGMEKALLIIEDADIKKTLRVSNLPWNLDPSRFLDWINTIAKENQMSIGFEIDAQFKQFLSDASYVFITLNSFKEAMQMFELINTYEYSGRKIYAEFRRGCGRFISGEILENYFSASREEREKAHIDRRTKQKEAWVKKHSSD